MSRILKRYELAGGYDTQAIHLPKRARILFVATGRVGPALCTVLEEDADTRAFDTGQHQRFFVVVPDGSAAPEVGVYVGSVQTAGHKPQSTCLHVFEVRAPGGSR
jgi:hypothetical protein